MGKSVSVTLGRGSLNHNNRVFSTENVDPTLTKNNIIFKHQSLKEAYREIFGAALEQYNDKQKRNDRKIPDYLEHIRKSKNGEKEYHELVVQVGDRYDTGLQSADALLAKNILSQYYEAFLKRNPNMRVFNAVLHMDEGEGTPHLHIDFIPVATGQTRGLEIKNSMRQALEQQGYDYKPIFVNEDSTRSLSYAAPQPKIGGGRWLDNERKALADILRRHGIEHEKKGVDRDHLSVAEYKACAEIIDKNIRATPPPEIEMREPTRPMRFAGVKEDEVLVKRSSIAKLEQQNVALRAQAELDRETIRRTSIIKAETDAFVQRRIKSAAIIEEKAEKAVAATTAQYSAGTAEKYNELVQKYNHLTGAYTQVKTGFSALEQQNSMLQSAIPKKIEQAVLEVTTPLQQENSKLRAELERWKQNFAALQEKVRGLCQSIVDIMRAVYTLNMILRTTAKIHIRVAYRLMQVI